MEDKQPLFGSLPEQVPLLSRSPAVGESYAANPETLQQKRQWTTLLTNKDWWAVWVSLLLLIPLLSICLDYDLSSVMPTKWKKNPVDAWQTNQQIVGFIILCLASILVICLALTVVEVLTQHKSSNNSTSPSLNAFGRNTLAATVVSLMALLAWWISVQASVDRYGITFEVWALIIGMVVSNARPLPAWLKPGSDGEFFVKVGLVLLGLDLRAVAALGGPGILSSWVSTPFVIIVSVLFAFYVLGMRDTKQMAFILVCGASVCGSSAATAIHGCVGGHPDILTVAIAIINLFTIPQMIGLPYFAYYTGMRRAVAGAWLGSTIDATGAVVAAGSLFDELQNGGCTDDGQCATDIAATIKLVQNILIGPVAVFVSLYWIKSGSGASQEEPECQKQHKSIVRQLWDTFPKFVLGFLICSAILTILNAVVDSDRSASFQVGMRAASRWFFCLGFVGIGLKTDIRKLASQLHGGKPILLYMFCQLLDLVLKFGFSQLSFGVIES
eukprot:m.12300 g.12300  ORF g.12300 m.12300 type:complete len:499 (+) comp6829_c0_seq1:101-1597(+)